jgi:branched-chain amino acid transport system permease protein
MVRRIAAFRSRLLCGGITALLFLLPFLTDSRSLLILLTQIFIFAVFAMSYDLLLGYTGIVSFGHAMFFGIGAYTVGIWMKRGEATTESFLLSILVTIALAALVSYLVGMLSLRLKSHYYAMLTLAFAGLFQVAAEKWRGLTMGNDGFTFSVPDWLRDRETVYFIALFFMIFVFYFLLRFTRSPMGRVLQAIRENEQRTEALGYRVLDYKVAASVLSGILAGLSGLMYGLTLRFVNTSVFSVEITLDVLLMTIIGGVGTLVGGIVGAALIELTHDALTDLAKVHPLFERWIILFGIVYILAVLFFPKGIVGTLQNWRFARPVRREPDAGFEGEKV